MVSYYEYASKIIQKILLERIRAKTESTLAENQAGFRRGRCTRDQDIFQSSHNVASQIF